MGVSGSLPDLRLPDSTQAGPLLGHTSSLATSRLAGEHRDHGPRNHDGGGRTEKEGAPPGATAHPGAHGKCRGHGGEERRLRCALGYLLFVGTHNLKDGPHR
jgi:hypothetical protein